MGVSLTVEQDQHPIDEEKFQRQAQNILQLMNRAESELSILIVDDMAMAELNDKYRGRSGPTNVLAFSMQEGEFTEITPMLLGDVVISADTAFRESQAAGIPLETRMLELLIHGVLHLCGYDHEASEEALCQMEEKHRFILEQL